MEYNPKVVAQPRPRNKKLEEERIHGEGKEKSTMSRGNRMTGLGLEDLLDGLPAPPPSLSAVDAVTFPEERLFGRTIAG